MKQVCVIWTRLSLETRGPCIPCLRPPSGFADNPWLSLAYIIAPLLSKVSPCLSGWVNYVLLFYKCGISDWTPGLGKARQVPYHWAMSPASWSSSKGKGQVVLKACPTRVGPFWNNYISKRPCRQTKKHMQSWKLEPPRVSLEDTVQPTVDICQGRNCWGSASPSLNLLCFLMPWGSVCWSFMSSKKMPNKCVNHSCRRGAWEEGKGWMTEHAGQRDAKARRHRSCDLMSLFLPEKIYAGLRRALATVPP